MTELPIEIYGNISGLPPAAVKTLERLYRRRVPSDNLTTPELTKTLVEASVETGRQVGVLVHRSGQVDYVIVGDAGRLMLPDIGRLRAAEGRFRGLRLIHTHLRGEPLTHDDLVDLVRLRLDIVAAIQLGHGGEPRSIMYAYNMPSSGDSGDSGALPYRTVGPELPSRVHVNVAALMGDLEAEFARLSRARTVRAKDGRAILVHVAEKSQPYALGKAEASIRELRELARTAGTDVVDTVIQLRDRIDPKFVVGKGKLEDLILRAMQLDAEVLVFDRELSPAQASAVAKVADLKVIDRTQLILDIFAQRAESRDGKLQVELAQLKYSLPRLAQKDDSLSRLTGGIGGRGPGETKLEIGRRRAKERVTHLETQLRELAKRREQRRRKRSRVGVPIVAIVGYTNAGKSTLLNTLTASSVLAEDKLFATLDTRSRHLRVGWAGYGGREIVVTDTVGFIRNLPEDLFAAFRATFEEAADADILLQVVDASDPARDEHRQTTDALLAELGLEHLPVLLVFNKLDLLEPELRVRLERSHPEAVFLSATHRESTRPLLEKLAAMLADKWDASARGPSVATQGEGAAHGDSLDGEEDEDGEHGDDDDSYGDDDPTNDRKSFPRTIVRGLDANGVHSLRESSTEHASTLEDMLRAAGKGRGRKRTRVPS